MISSEGIIHYLTHSYTSIIIGTATITLQPVVSPLVSEDDVDVTIEVCVEINDLPAGGLGCDLWVDLSLIEDTAGA